MNYFATKITDGDVTIAGILFKKDVEVQVDNALYCYLNADKKNFRTEQKRIVKKISDASAEGGPIEKADLKTAVKPDKRK